MSATRRQSSRLAAKSLGGSSKRAEIVISDDEDTEGFFSSEEEQDEPAPRPRKRTRTSAAASSTSRRTNGGGRSTATGKFQFTKLPDSVQTVVMSWAAPRDLLRLAWTSKDMARVLMSRGAKGIWTSAREALKEPMPPLPDDVCELRWAHLIFGPARCFTCGAPNIHTIIFAFRRRACVPCMKANMVWEKKFGAKFPDQDSSVLALLAHSNIGPHAHGHSSNSKFFWVPDVQKTIEQLAERTAAGREALKRWKADKMLEAATIVEEIEQQVDWVGQAAEQRAELSVDNRAERRNLVEAKLYELGWDGEDIRAIRYQPKSNPTNPELTAAGWARIWKDIRPQLQEARRKRMCGDAAQVYEKSRVGQPVGQWRSLPAFDEVLKMPPFAALLARDVAEEEVTAVDYKSAAKETQQLTAAWSSKHKERLAEGIILPSFTGDRSVMVAAGLEGAELAVATFVCHSNTPRCLTLAQDINRMKFPQVVLPFIGVSEAMGHERLHSGAPVFECLGDRRWERAPSATSPSVEFSPRGSLAAISLLELLSLDPATTRPLDVDKLNARFRCAHCIRIQPDQHGQVVMDWRRCIAHHIASDTIPNHPPEPSWIQLNATATRAALQAEGKTGVPGASSRDTWVCGLCLGRYPVSGSRSLVVGHLQQTHAIPKPVQEDDFTCLGANQCPMAPITLYTSGHTNFICLRCPDGAKRARQFIRDGIRNHLKDAHKVQSPMEDKDFRGVE